MPPSKPISPPRVSRRPRWTLLQRAPTILQELVGSQPDEAFEVPRPSPSPDPSLRRRILLPRFHGSTPDAKPTEAERPGDDPHLTHAEARCTVGEPRDHEERTDQVDNEVRHAHAPQATVCARDAPRR